MNILQGKQKLLIAATGFVVIAAFGLSGCGDSDDDASPTTTTTTAMASNSTTTTTSTGASSVAKVSANSASRSEISAALASAGVSNADRWAGEVVEYRPYDSSDTSLAKLRSNLQKYNPGEDTMNKILSALQP